MFGVFYHNQYLFYGTGWGIVNRNYFTIILLERNRIIIKIRNQKRRSPIKDTALKIELN